MDVIALALSALALLTSVSAAWYVKGQRDAERGALELARLADARLKYGWRIEHVHKGLFVLRNVGWASARSVSIGSDQLVELQQGIAAIDLAPQQGVAFIAVHRDAKGTLDITITWTPWYEEESGEVVEDERVWREPLPSLPVPVRESGLGVQL